MPGQQLGKLVADVSQATEGRPTPESHQPKGRSAQGASIIAGFTCIRCGASLPATVEIDSKGCPACHETAPANLRPVYVRPADPGSIVANAPRSLWRYAHALPCAVEGSGPLGEGQTPLIEATRARQNVGFCESRHQGREPNPTWSHKDRFSTVAVSVARAQGARVVATASSGNAGASLAAYAACAGLQCVVTTFAGSAGAMLAQIRKYGATVLPLVNKMDRWTMLAEAASRYGWFVTSPYLVRLPLSEATPSASRATRPSPMNRRAVGGVAPDWCALPVCYGDALSGLWAGFQELFAQRAITRLPKIAIRN